MWPAFYLLGVAIFLIWIMSSPFYWRSRRIPYLVPWPIFGNYNRMILLGINRFLDDLYQKFPGKRYFGMHMFTRPAIFIKDPELIQKMFTTGFDHFSSRGFYVNQERDPAASGLLFVHGQQWKDLQRKLRCAFTPGKINTMVSGIENTLPKAERILEKCIQDGVPVNAEDLVTKIIIDFSSQAIFGVQSDIFENDKSFFHGLARQGTDLLVTSRIFVSIISPKLYNLLRFTLLGENYNYYMENVMAKATEFKKQGLTNRQDFIQETLKLMEMNRSSGQDFFPDGTRVPQADLKTALAQTLNIYIAASETTSLAISFCMYELAIRPEMQAKCRAEVYEVLNRDKCDRITADNAASLVYLYAFFLEAMRFHTNLNMFTRECTMDYKVPDSDLIIEKGTFILMSAQNIHMDPKYHTDPEVFQPERFLDEEKNTIKPGTYMSFGLGPRHCLGKKLARAAMCIIVSRLLQRYEFSASERLNVPMKHSSYSFLTTPATKIWLNVRPLNQKS